MDLKKQLYNKNKFLKKAYEEAYNYDPSNPLSVSLNPVEFGKSIGFNKQETTRIMIELVEDNYVTSSLGMGMLLITSHGVNYLRSLEFESNYGESKFNIEIGDHASVNIQQDTINSNIISQSNNTSINQKFNEAQKTINEIKKVLSKNNEIEIQKAEEIRECLEEIENNVKNKTKPKFAIKSLIELTSNISSISELVLNLSQIFGVI